MKQYLLIVLGTLVISGTASAQPLTIDTTQCPDTHYACGPGICCPR